MLNERGPNWSSALGLPLVVAAAIVSAAALAPACSSGSGVGSGGTGGSGGSSGSGGWTGDSCGADECVQPGCGASGEACCVGDTCNAGLGCNAAGTCAPATSNCGAIDQTCCANDTCNTGLACVGGACKTTGQMGAPCTKNGDCPSGLCVSIGKTNVCTINCVSAAGCVPGWTCEMSGGETTKICKCEPLHEVCDGLDNDCDGVVDNQPDGECLYVVAMERANGIAVDATNLYFTTYTGGTSTGDKGVRKVALAGGAPTTLATTPQPNYDNPKAIAVDAGSVYWTSDAAAGYIMKVPIAGGAPTTLAAGEDSPKAIALDQSNLYWTNNYQFGGCCSAGTVKSVPLGGGTITTLMAQKTYTAPEGIAVDATNVYFADSNKGELWKIALGGGTPVSMSMPTSVGPVIAIDATSIYYSSASGVMKLPLTAVDGGTATMLAPGYATSLAIDGTSIYWTESPGTAPTTGTVKKVALGGGTPVTLASGQGWPACVTVDGTNVYWTEMSESGVGRILKRTK